MTKTVAITGSASGIGLAATQRLLAAGWTVYGLDRAQQAEPAGDFKPVRCDVSDAGSVTAAFAGIATPLNALICCAGVLRTGLM